MRLTAKKVERACRQACVALDERSYAMGHVEMGTTMVLASIEGDILTIAHAGDSRCYLHRPGEGLLYQTKYHARLDFGWEVTPVSYRQIE
ncbi:MAG: protein phosphatase 2C family protein [Prevotella sp.]|nr:protein phosphatase 2C family protein [Prevotella sp.]